MYIHYKHVREFNVTDMPIILKLNYWSLWIGAFTCLGLSIVANFQVSLTYASILRDNSYKWLFVPLRCTVRLLYWLNPSVCDHLNESYWAILSCGTVYYAVQGGSYFSISDTGSDRVSTTLYSLLYGFNTYKYGEKELNYCTIIKSGG